MIETESISYSLDSFAPGTNESWSEEHIRHIYRRLGFGAAHKTLQLHTSSSNKNLVKVLIQDAKNQKRTPAPLWANYTLKDYDVYKTDNVNCIKKWRIQAGNDFINKSIKGRMMLFWMNHFVVRHEVHGHAPFLFQYYNLIERNALGNFKSFVLEVGLAPAMLQFLNGFDNRKEAPNENYARELFELFTLGEGNGSTQKDIVETAKALTGYNHQDGFGNKIYFDKSTHDTSQKTIFGHSGNWGYEDVIEILFQERGHLIAKFIVEKIYRNFVNPHISKLAEQKIIEPLSNSFVQNKFELSPLMIQLFSSDHFFDKSNIGVIIKSPLDLMIQFVKESDLGYNKSLVRSMMSWAFYLGQRIFNPPNVAGWTGDKDWINTATLMGRWEMTKKYLKLIFEYGDQTAFVKLARVLSGDSDDPEYVSRSIVDHFMPRSYGNMTHYDVAGQVFRQALTKQTDNELMWNLNHPQAAAQVYDLMLYLITLPEFQLK
jgi:uncharacterized protein (DUF1800 family)